MTISGKAIAELRKKRIAKKFLDILPVQNSFKVLRSAFSEEEKKRRKSLFLKLSEINSFQKKKKSCEEILGKKKNTKTKQNCRLIAQITIN